MRSPRITVSRAIRAARRHWSRWSRWLRTKRASLTPAYSPAGSSDEPANVRDERYSLPFDDDPVVLPMQSRRATYIAFAVAVITLTAMIAALAHTR